MDVNACAGRTICLHQNQIVGACRGRFGPATDRGRHAAARTDEPSVVTPSVSGYAQGVVTSAEGESSRERRGSSLTRRLAPPPTATGPTASKRFRQAPTTCASGWGVWRHHSPPSRSGPEPNRPAQLPAKAPSSRRRSGLQALEDVPVVLSGGQRVRPGWRARPQVARARRGSRPLFGVCSGKSLQRGSPSRTSLPDGLRRTVRSASCSLPRRPSSRLPEGGPTAVVATAAVAPTAVEGPAAHRHRPHPHRECDASAPRARTGLRKSRSPTRREARWRR